MQYTTADVVQICKQHGFYSTPELNERLYLHCKGLSSIPDLAPFSGAKALWLESNCIERIENLEGNGELMTIYLARNAIESMGGLSALHKLCKLDLNENFIAKVEGLAGCTSLQELCLQKNNLKTVTALSGLLDVASTISSLDLSHNPLEYDEKLLDLLERLPKLTALRLNGTALAKGFATYRKSVITRLRSLRSFDDSPVTEVERNAADAFFVGGWEAERDVKAAAKQQKIDEEVRMMDRFNTEIEAIKQRRIDGCVAEHTAYYHENRKAADTTPFHSIAEETVEGVFEVAHETDARDLLRQNSIRPRTQEELTSLINSNAQNADIGSDWDSAEYDVSDPEDNTKSDEKRIARDKRAAKEGKNLAMQKELHQATNLTHEGANSIVERAIRREQEQQAALHANPTSLKQHFDPSYLSEDDEDDDEEVEDPAEDTEDAEDFAARKRREQQRESAWARGEVSEVGATEVKETPAEPKSEGEEEDEAPMSEKKEAEKGEDTAPGPKSKETEKTSEQEKACPEVPVAVNVSAPDTPVEEKFTAYEELD